MNKIKQQIKSPEFMELARVISIYKGKGDKLSLESDRGIFILSVLRMIKDRMIYNDIKDEVDNNMSESNIGARKDRNIRDHLFVLYSIINSVKNKETEPVDISFFDVSKCFDSLWLEECCNDLFEVNIKNDKLAMVYESGQNNVIKIDTPVGETDKIVVKNIVSQGGVLGGMQCLSLIHI